MTILVGKFLNIFSKKIHFFKKLKNQNFENSMQTFRLCFINYSYLLQELLYKVWNRKHNSKMPKLQKKTIKTCSNNPVRKSSLTYR